MDTIVNLLNTLGPLVGILAGTGLFVKYVPFMKGIPNTIIPLLNALIAFLTAFGGLTGTAHAGIFGDVAHELGIFGKVGASFVVSGMASWFYESHLRGLLDKFGFKAA